LGSSGCGNQLNILHAGGLGDLIVQARDFLDGPCRGDIDANIPNLQIKVGGVDEPFLI
jgi:hypothetical protein